MAQTYTFARVRLLVEWLNREKRFMESKPKTVAEQHWASGYIAGLNTALDRIAEDMGVTSDVQKKLG